MRTAGLTLDENVSTPSVVLFRELKWIPIHNIIKMKKILIVSNVLRFPTPEEDLKLFVLCRELHEANTRSSLTDFRLRIVKPELAKTKLSYSRVFSTF